MLIRTFRIMMEEVLCTGQHTKALLIAYVFFYFWMLIEDDKIKKVVHLCIGLPLGNLEACTILVEAGKKEDLIVADNTGLTPAKLGAEKNHRQVAFFLGNACRLLDRHWDSNSQVGKLSKLGLAPVLWFVILLLLGLYTHSVILDVKLPRLTAGFGLLAWLGVFLASAGFFLFYKCSRFALSQMTRPLRH